MTRDDLLALIQEEVKGLSTYLIDSDYINAVDDALRETQWILPTVGEAEFWLKQRAKRHIFFYLFTESAHKFKYKQINLQNRFAHYKDLIGLMDKEFKEFADENPHLFAGVEAFKLFGTKIDAGFAYDRETGKDITYQSTQEVIFAPTEND